MWKVNYRLKDENDESQQEFCLLTILYTIYSGRNNAATVYCVFYYKKMKKIIFYGGRHNVECVT